VRRWWQRWQPTVDIAVALFIIMIALLHVTDPWDWRAPLVLCAGGYLWWRVLNQEFYLKQARRKAVQQYERKLGTSPGESGAASSEPGGSE